MSKKNNWLTSILKRFFISEAEFRPEKGKRKRWMLGLFSERSKKEAASTSTDNQHKQRQQEDEVPDLFELRILAAIKIQTAFRGYLGRKALRAMKGIVRLQAMVRGQAVRRQAVLTLQRLQSVVDIQSQVRERGYIIANISNEKDIKIDLNSSHKMWDYRAVSKEDANAMSLSKREASFKRERIKEYWLSHRKSTSESEKSKINTRRYWLEDWVDSELAKIEEDGKALDGVCTSGGIREMSSLVSPRAQNGGRRLSFHHHHKRQHSISVASSPAAANNTMQQQLPAYMASTKSVEAKARSMSTPRLRPMHHFDLYSTTSDNDSPFKYKYKLSPVIRNEARATKNSSMVGGRHHRSSFTQRSLHS